jgi:hypothetical protein
VVLSSAWTLFLMVVGGFIEHLVGWLAKLGQRG